MSLQFPTSLSLDSPGDPLESGYGRFVKRLPSRTQPTQFAGIGLAARATLAIEAMLQAIPLTQLEMGTGITHRIPPGFLATEELVAGRFKKLQPIRFQHVAQPQFRLYEEIAGIDVAIVLDQEVLSAIPAHSADNRSTIHQIGQNGIKKPYGNTTGIRVPLFVDLPQKLTPLSSLDREG